MSTATMTTNGRVTIPKDVRDALGLVPGMKVEFVRAGPRDYVIRALPPQEGSQGID
jgi:antitoxin PrlF